MKNRGSTMSLALELGASARIRVVSTYPELDDLVRQLGGNRVQTSSLARPQDDPHLVTPRPSLALELSRAKLFVRIGMDLDLWADDMLAAARNVHILKGAAGYVDCSLGIKRLEVPTGPVDPSQGDLHLYGNPHFLLDPENAKVVARNILEGLKRVDPAGTAEYEHHYQQFIHRLDQLLPHWQKRLAPFQGSPVVSYHRTFIYFFRRFRLEQFGTLEPKPGIPPSPGHLRALIERMKSAKCRVILIEHFRPRRFPEAVARETGAHIAVVPITVGVEGANDYFGMIEIIVSRLANALQASRSSSSFTHRRVVL